MLGRQSLLYHKVDLRPPWPHDRLSAEVASGLVLGGASWEHRDFTLPKERAMIHGDAIRRNTSSCLGRPHSYLSVVRDTVPRRP